MKLSDSLFKDVVNGLKLPDGRAPRTMVVGRATIIPCVERVGHRPAAVVIRDVSPTGIGLVHIQQLFSGEQFILCPPEIDRREPRLLLCQVVHSEPLPQGLFSIGATFTRMLSAGPGEYPVIPVQGLVAAFRREAEATLRALDESDEQVRHIEARLGMTPVK